MSERPPEFVDLEEEEEFVAREEPAAAEEPVQDEEAEFDGNGNDDVVGRAAAVLKYIVERIVDDPAQISIGATTDDRGPVLLLSVAEDDRGKVIGRQGRIVQAIRTIVKAATVGTGERVNVEIVD
ncbi:MAG: KH domain-containing protein [Candidatus Eremiobacteraeota bacterium]|nr:KH domain-containing protein [Candidatus Eremiobacteraeota bacterium]